MTKLNNGEGNDGTAAVQKTQMLPDNGMLWNLDRIDQRSLPLDREYTCRPSQPHAAPLARMPCTAAQSSCCLILPERGAFRHLEQTDHQGLSIDYFLMRTAILHDCICTPERLSSPLYSLLKPTGMSNAWRQAFQGTW